jgi:hypothetical protein
MSQVLCKYWQQLFLFFYHSNSAACTLAFKLFERMDVIHQTSLSSCSYSFVEKCTNFLLFMVVEATARTSSVEWQLQAKKLEYAKKLGALK